MCATPISGAAGRRPRWLGWRLRLATFLLACASVPVPAAYTNRAATAASGAPDSEAQRLRRHFTQAEARHTRAPGDAEAAWEFARACFEWADAVTNDTQRARVANQGVAACRQLIAQAPRRVEGHYYLGLNLGELARTETVRALKRVREMEQEFKTALTLDPQFDYAGPDRALGLLYQDAPGWPVSLGSRKRAREHLRQAVELAPGFPENRLCLLEALLEWGDLKAARAELAATEASLRHARTELTGEDWSIAWADWNDRLARAKASLDEKAETLRCTPEPVTVADGARIVLALVLEESGRSRGRAGERGRNLFPAPRHLERWPCKNQTAVFPAGSETTAAVLLPTAAARSAAPAGSPPAAAAGRPGPTRSPPASSSSVSP